MNENGTEAEAQRAERRRQVLAKLAELRQRQTPRRPSISERMIAAMPPRSSR